MKRTAIVLFCCLIVVLSCACNGREEKDNSEIYEENIETGFRRTTLYYLSDDGFVVPVMKRIPWEEGIGKAALSYITGGTDNDKSAAEMGLNTVIPEGTEYTLKIDDGVAVVNMKSLTAFDSQGEEAAMVTAIVNTLTEFSSIDSVKITLDGKTVNSLPNGTDISRAMSVFALNTENGEVAVSGDANAMTLYFPTYSAGLNIPVTRYINAEPSFAAAVNELVKGTEDSRLLNVIPAGTQLNKAYINEGIAKVDFNASFKDIEYVEGMLEAARDVLCLCAGEYEDVYGVDIYVDGEEYSLHSEALSAPLYVNEFR